MPLSPIQNDLLATDPHPDLAEPLMVFGQFVGTWDMDVQFFDDSGSRVYREPGTWAFGWVLDGRVIQDVLTYPPVGDPAGTAPGVRGIGTSVRFYDARADSWQVFWLGAVTGITVVLHGGQIGDELVLDSDPEPDGTLNRWTFTEITGDSFLWTGHESRDDGQPWRLVQRMAATRQEAGV